jgi:hypothetical protein
MGGSEKIRENWFERLLGLIPAVVFDPIVFVSLVAPLTIGVALRLIRGDFAIYAGESEVLKLLINVQLAGIVDYALQFYTALLGWTLLVFKTATTFYERTDLKVTLHGRVYLISFVVSFFLGLWLFFLGGAASRSLLETYASQQYELGIPHWPIVSRLLLIRILTALMAIWLLRLTSKKEDCKQNI